MIKKIFIFVLLGFMTMSFIGSEWKEVNSEGDIKVYNKTIKGYDMPQSRVETVLKNGSLWKAKKMLQDYNSYKDWVPSCSSSKLVEKKNGKYIYYATFDAPWPVSDRDLYAEATFVETSNSIKMTSRALPNYKKEKDGFIRISLSNGEYLFKKDAKGLFMRNMSLASPGGSIPAWLTTTAVEDIPLELMQNIVEKVKK